jgi:DNA processing protein
MIPYSFFAETKIKSFVYKRELHKQANNLEELGETILSFLDYSWAKERIKQSKIFDQIYREKGCGFMDYYDPNYPSQLRNIYDPPIVLFYWGNPEILRGPFYAVVGTRKASAVSLFATRKTVEFLKESGYGIVSGMALGIDREAMDTSIHCNMPTLGVLGTPVYIEYPYSNRLLYKKMKSNSLNCLISELLPLEHYAKWTFPKRNRIITGIAERVYLMETPTKSGAMSSAQNAIDQNKDVLVFSNTKQSFNQGGDSLIEDGAESFGLNDLGLTGEIKHITDLIEVNSPSSHSAWLEYSTKLSNTNQQTVQHLGNGYYYIFKV